MLSVYVGAEISSLLVFRMLLSSLKLFQINFLMPCHKHYLGATVMQQ